jgi:hypothetical protein
MSWKRQQEFVGRYIKFARKAAWGDNLNIPGLDAMPGSGMATPPPAPPAREEGDEPMQPQNRRERRAQEKSAKKEKPEKKLKVKKEKASPSPARTPTGIAGPKKRVVAENGKILVVDSVGNVYLEQKDESGETHEFLLDVCISSTPPSAAIFILFYILLRSALHNLFKVNAKLTNPSPKNSKPPPSATRPSTASQPSP